MINRVKMNSLRLKKNILPSFKKIFDEIISTFFQRRMSQISNSDNFKN